MISHVCSTNTQIQIHKRAPPSKERISETFARANENERELKRAREKESNADRKCCMHDA